MQRRFCPGIFLFLVFFSCSLSAQDSLLVLDENQHPLAFAYVETLVANERNVQETGLNGKVWLPDGLEQVRVSLLGYRATTFSVQELAERKYTINLPPAQAMLKTATVVGRRNENYRELNQQVGIIEAAEISRAQSLTTADALADLGGVYVQKSQYGGGSPVVRGFEANRVLLVVDGVRMNNAIFRNGHLQNAITIDPLSLSRIELLFGPGALAYGSDAIGGVVHFRTQKPQFRARTQDAVDGKLSMSVSSAAQASVISGRLEYGAENWAGLTLLSLSATSHLRAGAQRPDRFPEFGLRTHYVERRNGEDLVVANENPNVQIGTAYRQYNLLQKLRFRLRDKLELSANFQFSTSSDVPRYDALTERRDGRLRWARWDYGPQTRVMGSLRLEDRRATSLYDLATYLVSYQFVGEDRITRFRGDVLEENNLVDVNAVNVQTDFVKSLSAKLRLGYGADVRYDEVASEAFLRNVDNGSLSFGAPTRYPSQGSSLAAVGAYAESRLQLGSGWALRGGVRLSRQRLSGTFGSADPVEWPQEYLEGITNTESAATFTLGLRRVSGLRLLYAEGFRAPNIDDFAKFRERSGFIQVPNPALQPERTHTLEAGYRWDHKVLFGKPFTAELTAYHTWMVGAIVRQEGRLPNGNSFFVSRGDTLLAQSNVNAQNARVYGADLVLNYQLTKAISLRTDLHYLRGRRFAASLGVENGHLPQAHIPPPYGSTSLGYKHGKWTVDLRFRYQAAKKLKDYAVGQVLLTPDNFILDRTGTSDNLELSPANPDGSFAGTYAWWTANIAAQYTPSDRLTLRLKADNLLDKHYRTFASGVSAPGIDIGLGLEWGF